MNPISGNSSPQQELKPMQDVVPPPGQSAPQSSTGTNGTPIQPEIVNDLPVKAQDTSLSQAQTDADNPVAGNSALGPAPANQIANQDDKELDKVLKDVNHQVKAADNKPPKVSIFKRWESVIITIVALGIAVALCLAAISALKNQ